MQTKSLPGVPDVIAPDGSDVRILLGVAGGTMAHFELGAGETSVAVRHRTVEELWYFLGGSGEMWRRGPDGDESIVEVGAGVCIDIPVGTTFQFRATADGPVSAIGATMPPWPGEGEAVLAEGPWQPTVKPGPA
jgi:mannose-6-phosphate isomerase-like protein (cupin superfamily)